MKNPCTQICNLIQSKMNEIIEIINQTDSILKADKLHSESVFAKYAYINYAHFISLTSHKRIYDFVLRCLAILYFIVIHCHFARI
jgi:hypothetical protein